MLYKYIECDVHGCTNHVKVKYDELGFRELYSKISSEGWHHTKLCSICPMCKKYKGVRTKKTLETYNGAYGKEERECHKINNTDKKNYIRKILQKLGHTDVGVWTEKEKNIYLYYFSSNEHRRGYLGHNYEDAKLGASKYTVKKGVGLYERVREDTESGRE